MRIRPSSRILSGLDSQPLFKDGFLMIDLERQLFVLREITVRANTEDSHG